MAERRPRPRGSRLIRLLTFLALAISLGVCIAQIVAPIHASETDMKNFDAIGLWVTADGHVRHNLLPGGRYDEARGNVESAYRGSYTVSGNHIDYKDDTGFTADGEFRDGILYHGGMVLYRR